VDAQTSWRATPLPVVKTGRVSVLLVVRKTDGQMLAERKSMVNALEGG